MKGIESRLLNVEELFLKDGSNNHPQFVVPEYQRGYSWGCNDKCDALWQDIVTCVATEGEGKTHFLGSVIIDKSDNNTLKLVDGQQRVTTFILLLKALLVQLNERIAKISSVDSTVDIIQHNLMVRRNTILKCLYVVDDDGVFNINASNLPLSECKIKYDNRSMNETRKDELKIILQQNNFESAEMAVEKSESKRGDNKYSNFFRNFKFFYNRFSEVDTTLLNGYAKSILECCRVVVITSYDTEQAIEIFNSLNSKMMPLTDADILSANLYKNTKDENQAKFKDDWEQLKQAVNDDDDKMNQLLNQYMYTIRAQKKYESTTLKSVRSFFTQDEKDLLLNPTNFVSALKDILDLSRPPAHSALCNLQKLCTKFNSNFALFYIPYLYIKNEDGEELKIKYLNALLKMFALLEISETVYSSSKFKAKLFKLNASLSNKPTTEIIEQINEHIKKEFNKSTIEENLKNNPVKHPIIYLNEVLYAIKNKKSIDFIHKQSINIEHIMPNSGRDLDAIRKDADINSMEEFKEVVNLIGNKILLEENINKSIGRSWFTTKKQSTIADRTGYKNSQFPIASDLVDYKEDKWQKQDIADASQKASKRIADYIFNPNSIIK